MITREHVTRAFGHLKKYGISPNIDSTKWDIIDPETLEAWPPKAVLRVAYELAGKDRPDLGGGWPTNDPLKALGFEIRLKPNLEKADEVADIEEIINSRNRTETEKRRLVNARLGQGGFRSALEGIWAERCALTGCAIRALLRASHIRPWRTSTDAQRLNPDNGLLLVANADALFDRGLMTFAYDGTVLYAAGIKATEIGLPTQKAIPIGIATQELMKFHREEVFIRRTAD